MKNLVPPPWKSLALQFLACSLFKGILIFRFISPTFSNPIEVLRFAFFWCRLVLASFIFYWKSYFFSLLEYSIFLASLRTTSFGNCTLVYVCVTYNFMCIFISAIKIAPETERERKFKLQCQFTMTYPLSKSVRPSFLPNSHTQTRTHLSIKVSSIYLIVTAFILQCRAQFCECGGSCESHLMPMLLMLLLLGHCYVFVVTHLYHTHNVYCTLNTTESHDCLLFDWLAWVSIVDRNMDDRFGYDQKSTDVVRKRRTRITSNMFSFSIQ